MLKRSPQFSSLTLASQIPLIYFSSPFYPQAQEATVERGKDSPFPNPKVEAGNLGVIYKGGKRDCVKSSAVVKPTSSGLVLER